VSPCAGLVTGSALIVYGIASHESQLGRGTYTGIEAVPSNVNTLGEPRVRTGKWTMMLMALSLSLTATGIVLLYLLWGGAAARTGAMLNAVVFGDIVGNLGLHGRSGMPR
jgi:hypothetical protein